MPERVPGPSTTHSTPSNHRDAIRRSWEVASGTEELTAIPVTAPTSSPSRSSSWVSTTACSSGVRDGSVESRQWCASPRVAVRSPLSGGRAVAWRPARRARRPSRCSRRRSRAASGHHRLQVETEVERAHAVGERPPLLTASTPAAAYAGALSTVMPPGGLDEDLAAARARTLDDARRDERGRHVVEQHGVGARRRRASSTCAGGRRTRPGRTRPGHARPGPRHRLGDRRGRRGGCPSAGSTRTSDERWLRPPPARTAAFSSARSPGVVFRVSRTATRRDRRDRVDERPRRGRDPREVAQEVERGALGGHDRAHRPVHGRDDVAGRPGGRRRGARTRPRRWRPRHGTPRAHRPRPRARPCSRATMPAAAVVGVVEQRAREVAASPARRGLQRVRAPPRRRPPATGLGSTSARVTPSDPARPPANTTRRPPRQGLELLANVAAPRLVASRWPT